MYAFALQTSYGPPPLETHDWIAVAAIAVALVLFAVVMHFRRVRHEGVTPG